MSSNHISIRLNGMLVRQEQVRAPLGAIGEVGREVELHGIDLALCSAWLLDPVWIFDGRLNFADVHRALVWLVTEFPELGGRMTARGVLISNIGVPLSEVQLPPQAATQNALDASSPHLASGFTLAGPDAREPPRGLLTDLRDVEAVINGEAPVMTVRLTLFPDARTSALGVCLTHALCDGYGAYSLLLLFAKALSLRTPHELARLSSHVQQQVKSKQTCECV